MELTLKEAKRIIKYIIENNKRLQAKGEFPHSLCLSGVSGIGKSSLIDQIASETGSNYVKLSLANISEPSDLVGFPQREYYVCKDDDCTWITAELIEIYRGLGYKITDETRMGYAVPAWIKELDPSKPSIVNIDDFNRASGAILAAIMELINRQEYISWKLPPNTTILLSMNPDNGEYLVSSIDDAIQTRMCKLDVKFDKNEWAEYAERKGLDGRAISFLLLHSEELMDRSVAKTSKINARSYTMFANIISGIDDWSTPENLAFIVQIASGCFNDEDNIVGGLFSNFIANKLDKLISPEDLVHKSWAQVKAILEDQLYDGDIYRADIASVITTRFINYSFLYFAKPDAKTDVICNRILELVENDKILLTEDLLFNLIYQLNQKYPVKLQKLILNPKISRRLI